LFGPKDDLGRDLITFKLVLNFFQKIRGKMVWLKLTTDELRQIRSGNKLISR
jgi:hypothetical protein